MVIVFSGFTVGVTFEIFGPYPMNSKTSTCFSSRQLETMPSKARFMQAPF